MQVSLRWIGPENQEHEREVHCLMREEYMRMQVRWLMVAGMLSCIGPAVAHHSTSMFDYSKEKKLNGVVRNFQWTNPHSFIQVLVPDEQGVQQEWSVECGTPTQMAMTGWNKNSLKPGDKVTISIAPMRDGTNGGTLRTATFQDGKVLRGAADNFKVDESGKPAGIALPSLQRATPK